MDAHLFRRYCRELVPALVGARIEKIHQPADGTVMLALFGLNGRRPHLTEKDSWMYSCFDPKGERQEDEGRKNYLIMKSGRKAPLMFVSEHRVSVGTQPPAAVMRLRKYLGQSRIVRAYADWIARVLFIQVQDGPCLRLDLKNGPELLIDAPLPDLAALSDDLQAPEWFTAQVPPVTGLWEKACLQETAESVPAGKDGTVMTPLLRRTLAYLDEADASALYADLESGEGDVFVYDTPGGRTASAFPLPDGLCTSMKASGERIFESAVEAMAYAGETLFSVMADEARAKAAKPFAAEVRRLDKLLEKLGREKERLENMAAKKKDALALQAELYRFDKDGKTDRIETSARTVMLDPKYTVAENMEKLFHQAGRGTRGLEHLRERVAEVRNQRENAARAAEERMALQSGTGVAVLHKEKEQPRGPIKQGRGEHGAVNKGAKNAVSASAGLSEKQDRHGRNRPKSEMPSNVQAFRSSDGFIILRGRDTKGNGAALKMAAPHDYWLHTAEGTSAHVIIRRDHAAHEVPETTLREAGILVALKSPYKDSATALIQYSLAKYIRPMRNAPAGMVRIDRSEGAFTVDVDREIEDKLRI